MLLNRAVVLCCTSPQEQRHQQTLKELASANARLEALATPSEKKSDIQTKLLEIQNELESAQERENLAKEHAEHYKEIAQSTQASLGAYFRWVLFV